MNILHVALDVCREAVARKFVAAVVVLILLAQIGLVLALDLDVVEGVITGSKLFGKTIEGKQAASAEKILQPVLRAIVYAVFHLGTIFGIVATSDIAIRLLSPGRVELSLSLPIRRWELAAGMYIGVLLLAMAGMLFAVSGFSVILFWKAEFLTIAPFIGAVSAALAFATVYAAMLLASCLVRSQALSSGVGMALYIVCLLTSNREQTFAIFERGWSRDIASVVIGPLPRLQTMVSTAWDVAAGQSDDVALLVAVTAGALAFAAACVTAAATAVWYKDY